MTQDEMQYYKNIADTCTDDNLRHVILTLLSEIERMARDDAIFLRGLSSPGACPSCGGEFMCICKVCGYDEQ